MKFIFTHVPVVEDELVKALATYISEIRWADQYPNHTNINIGNDHPFEEILGGTGDRPNLFPSITVVSSTDSEIPNMSKNWKVKEMTKADVEGLSGEDWYLSETSLQYLKIALEEKEKVYGLSHSTVWRDSVSFEIWSENMQVKNDLYSMLLAFLTGPKILQLKQDTDISVYSNTIQGQRSGYYNFDFGRILYGGRISFTADYLVSQDVYDTDIGSISDIKIQGIGEVLNG